MVRKLLCCILALLGLVGFLVCSMAIFGTWNAKVRLDQFTQDIFGIVDHSLDTVEQQVTNAQERIESLRITTETIEDSVKSWTRDAASESLRSRLDVETKADRLAAGIQQTDDWLKLADTSLQFVDRTLEAGKSSGLSVETDAVANLIDEIGMLRAQLGEMAEPIERIRQGVSAEEGEEAGETKFKQLADLTVRVIATFSSVDSRLENLEEQVGSVKTKSRNMEADAHWWIGVTSIGVTLLLAWMAAGQASLCYLGWRGLRLPAANI